MNETNVFSYIQLPGIILWSCIDPPLQLGWEGTLIGLRGNLNANLQEFPEDFYQFYMKKCNIVESNVQPPSKEWTEKLFLSARQNPERWRNSETLKIMEVEHLRANRDEPTNSN